MRSLWTGNECRAKHHKRRYWQPGEELTDRDRLLLRPLLDRAAELGHTPTQKEMQGISVLNERFRHWQHAVMAAGLPWLDESEQHRLRAEARKEMVLGDKGSCLVLQNDDRQAVELPVSSQVHEPQVGSLNGCGQKGLKRKGETT